MTLVVAIIGRLLLAFALATICHLASFTDTGAATSIVRSSIESIGELVTFGFALINVEGVIEQAPLTAYCMTQRGNCAESIARATPSALSESLHHQQEDTHLIRVDQDQ